MITDLSPGCVSGRADREAVVRHVCAGERVVEVVEVDRRRRRVLRKAVKETADRPSGAGAGALCEVRLVVGWLVSKRVGLVSPHLSSGPRTAVVLG
jgi:hypothetical protein